MTRWRAGALWPGQLSEPLFYARHGEAAHRSANLLLRRPRCALPPLPHQAHLPRASNTRRIARLQATTMLTLRAVAERRPAQANVWTDRYT